MLLSRCSTIAIAISVVAEAKHSYEAKRNTGHRGTPLHPTQDVNTYVTRLRVCSGWEIVLGMYAAASISLHQPRAGVVVRNHRWGSPLASIAVAAATSAAVKPRHAGNELGQGRVDLGDRSCGFVRFALYGVWCVVSRSGKGLLCHT